MDVVIASEFIIWFYTKHAKNFTNVKFLCHFHLKLFLNPWYGTRANVQVQRFLH
jgi:hypothetical protein